MLTSRPLLSAALLLLLVATPGTAASLSTGEPAPNFTLPDTSGAEHSLEDFRGKYVVLEWLNHGCPFVRAHYGAGNLQALQERWTDEGVVWLSIVSSAPGKQGHHPPAEADRLTEEKGAAPTAVLLDPEGEVGRAYAARTTPHMFVIGPEGTLLYQGALDDDPRVRAPRAATNYVTAALESARSGETVAVDATRPYGCSVKY
jgi:peroxiredoxin